MVFRRVLFLYHLDDAGLHRFAADRLGADDERAALVDRSSDDHIADRLRDGHRLARDHRLVERGSALLDLAIDRHLFARPNTETIADSYPIERHLLVIPVGPNAARGLGGEVEQRLDGARGPLAGAQLKEDRKSTRLNSSH